MGIGLVEDMEQLIECQHEIAGGVPQQAAVAAGPQQLKQELHRVEDGLPLAAGALAGDGPLF